MTEIVNTTTQTKVTLFILGPKNNTYIAERTDDGPFSVTHYTGYGNLHTERGVAATVEDVVPWVDAHAATCQTDAIVIAFRSGTGKVHNAYSTWPVRTTCGQDTAKMTPTAGFSTCGRC